jgi:hypothetical protein
MASPLPVVLLPQKRRSTRLPLNSLVAVSGQDRSKCSFTIVAKASNLNKHGGAPQITRELLVGTTVLVRNKRGTQISARVVSQINAEQGLLRYGIEFEEDPRAGGLLGNHFSIKCIANGGYSKRPCARAIAPSR